MRLVDLARPLENTDYADPPGLAPQITYYKHEDTAQQILDTVLHDLREFTGSDEFEDDVSISVIKFAPGER